MNRVRATETGELLLKLSDGTTDANINSVNELATNDYDASAEFQSLKEGNSFGWNPGVTFTDAVETPLFSMQYLGTGTLIVTIFYGTTNASTGGSGKAIIRMYANTGVVSGAGGITTGFNLNTDSTTLPASIISMKEGITGETMTLTDRFGSEASETVGSFRCPCEVALGINDTVGITIEPPTGNTSMFVNGFVRAYVLGTAKV